MGKKNNNDSKIPNVAIPNLNIPNFSANIPELQNPVMQKMMDQQKQAQDMMLKMKEELEELKKKLEPVKKQLIKKFDYIQSISIIPQQINNLIKEEFLTDPEYALFKPIEKEDVRHLLILIPEEKLKESGKVKEETIKLIEHIRPKLWISIRTPVDMWEICFDSKYELTEALSMSFPIFDKGFLGSLRVANVHKGLVLRKFEKYVVSYVIAGSLVRGDVTETSDVDVYVVIDDTDVKRMSRFELKERLRVMIYNYMAQAGEIAGVKNKLNVQIYILTEFWEAVKDAHPVIFTFIRDGVPLYDRGAFMPWKLLLKMGKIKPSPEAIDMFMSMGDKVNEIVKKKLLMIATEDIYWSLITPSQAALMLYGLAPPTPKEIIRMMKEVFVTKEKLLEAKYVDILEKVVKLYKDYEHQKVKSVSGKQVDELVKESKEYVDRLKKLVEQISNKNKKTTLDDLYNNVFDLLKKIFGNGSEQVLFKKFEKELINKGKLQKKNLRALNDLICLKNKLAKGIKKKKLKAKTKKKESDKEPVVECDPAKHEVELVRKDVSELINGLLDYIQRKELIELEKKRIKILYKEKDSMREADVYTFGDIAYIVKDLNSGDIYSIDSKTGTKKKIDVEEFTKVIESNKEKNFEKKISIAVLEKLREMFKEFDMTF
ncbi:hypothetical protein CO154_02745 [Candidatus Pacearchaeota archaeon CG_4_9_14_3_um_filter_31_7]|nr:MAG: hypothetical protein AUJ10_03665 [Candidatus Pacearchaeota archaeon CG1_02_31_27]PIN91841.1 MAG: hypothetical protein COU55_03620 [Candidatus Pacearchaeota archaeon CG10_big_fil_rev_8_21_14_0_10_31_59]PIZ80532.1 MAG: hypothetical protein COX99_02560 [Candidatus Pacearchaeota archaeon CG_4_10_14_0_2_um_filter_31_10]PJA70468.1 MAG: hypothetical protein CO154_02745 [Candidatus Pacearchaeota archaeon CG_4_9_14_3_um_filter_31_7]